MKIGFTGTQRGITYLQRDELQRRMLGLEAKLLIHGACIGADFEADRLACRLGIPRHAYPSDIANKRVAEEVLRLCNASELVYEPTPLRPLVRNHLIVHKCDMLIACPGEEFEVLRSGTWATIRYANKRNVPTIVIYPSGKVVNGKSVQSR
jgi:hypothetical protein